MRKGGLGEGADEKPGLQVPCPMTQFHIRLDTGSQGRKPTGTGLSVVGCKGPPPQQVLTGDGKPWRALAMSPA